MIAWRWKLRQARQALDDGRLDEARRLLAEEHLLEFLPARQLAREVARRLAERAVARVQCGQSAAGWRDLRAAKGLPDESSALEEARQTLVRLALARVSGLLEAGQLDTAEQYLRHLTERGVRGAETAALHRAVAAWRAALRLADQGEFSLAQRQWERVLAACPQSAAARDGLEQCRRGAGRQRELAGRLHRALDQQQWHEALAVSESWLRLAPQCEAARHAQRRAWSAVGAKPGCPTRDHVRPSETFMQRDESDQQGGQVGPRCLLWVDGAGGYLVCLGDKYWIGPPSPERPAELAIAADLSRRHARLVRDGEGYLLESDHAAQVDGAAVRRPIPLRDGSLIALGESVRLRFRQPHPLSASARLERVSRHRMQPAVDAVLLLADACVLGPGPASHVVCRHWSNEVLLFRRGEQLWCRREGGLQIDGVDHALEGPLTTSSRVCGEDFSFSLEPLS